MDALDHQQCDLHIQEGHVPVEITARLRDGIVMDVPYVADLAGILHSRYRLEHKGSTPDDSMWDEPTVYDLPLARCVFPDGWLWAASAAIPSSTNIIDPRTYYRRDDPAWASSYSERPIPVAVHPMRGPWRDVMMPNPTLVCDFVTWRAVGDPIAIERALKPLSHIGKRRSNGSGRVYEWLVETHDDIDDWLRWPYVSGQSIIRPCPAAVARAVPHIQAWHSMRPPAWNPSTMAHLATGIAQEV